MYGLTNFLNFLKTKDKLKVILSRNLREYIINCGVCPDCKRLNTGYAWCNRCDPGRFIKEGKTTGNVKMDNFILERQKQTLHCYDNLEWIPYNKFDNIKLIGEGGFSKIYSATWLEGPPKYDKKKARTGSIEVAFKKLKNPDIRAFINEIRIHDECNFANFHITQLYGITKDPDTKEFMMVLEYANYGNLRDYLKENYSTLKWEDKLDILVNIIVELEFIHDRNYIHKDLHSGNVLQFYYNGQIETKITDLGLAQLFNNSDSSNSTSICGVLPYVAPEILNGKPYSFKSDIYSFGIIMIEVSTGKPPHGNIPHDENLAIAICDGLRPTVAKGTPKCYIDLVNRCLSANPDERPSSKEILKVIRNWRFHSDHEKVLHSKRKSVCKDVEMSKEFIETVKDESELSSTETILHPKAVYISRPMKYNSLYCEPKNSSGTQIENSIFSDLQLNELNELVAGLDDSKMNNILTG
ncbi:kinase-like domain-containing protein [Rhizophagus diaphanus]|nr:kinase-like domain-containing protein [Rhizophagus diaphanus] [Rhizophagus sp. MUCL 43196]